MTGIHSLPLAKAGKIMDGWLDVKHNYSSNIQPQSTLGTCTQLSFGNDEISTNRILGPFNINMKSDDMYLASSERLRSLSELLYAADWLIVSRGGSSGTDKSNHTWTEILHTQVHKPEKVFIRFKKFLDHL